MRNLYYFHKTIMKRTLLYMSMLAAVLLSCNSNKSAKGSDADDESDVMEVKLKTYSYEQTAKHTEARITIDFPVGGDEELRQAIYDNILSFWQGEDPDDDPIPDFSDDGQGLVDYFGGITWNNLQEGWESWDEDDESDIVLDDNSSYKKLLETDRFITFLYETDGFYGGDGFGKRQGVTFLKDDGRKLTNDMLLKNPRSEKVLQLIRDKIRQENCEGAEAYVEEEIVDGIDKLPEAPLYLTDDGVGFNYAQYEVYWSEFSGVIPLEKIEKYLTDEAVELFYTEE